MVSPGISGGLGAPGALRVESAAARRVLLSGWGRSPAGTHASRAGAVRGNLGPVNRQQLTGCAPSGRRPPTRCGSWARGARAGQTARRAAGHAGERQLLRPRRCSWRPLLSGHGPRRAAGSGSPHPVGCPRRAGPAPSPAPAALASASVCFGAFSVPFFAKHTCVLPSPTLLRRRPPKGAFFCRGP